MNIKLKALLLTAMFFGTCLLAARGIEYIFTTFTPAQIAFAASVFGMSLITYAVYGLILARLEMEKSLDKLKKL